jgi:hypothetical protein
MFVRLEKLGNLDNVFSNKWVKRFKNHNIDPWKHEHDGVGNA